MRLKISHRSEYAYLSPVHYALQRVRLMPRSGYCQEVLSWTIKVEGATEEVFRAPKHPSTQELLGATPNLEAALASREAAGA